jgi:hypothetical protein
MIDDDPYTAEACLCDDAGMVSDQRVPPGQPGTATDPDLTYRRLLNNLRAHTGLPRYDGPDFQCPGDAHLAREHFRCTNPCHTTDEEASREVRPFGELRSSGLLWLINAAVFHPRGGFALAVVVRGGEVVGWRLLGDGTEPWYFDPPIDESFHAAEATLAKVRAGAGAVDDGLGAQ